MACDQIRDRLSEYIDGFLPGSEASRVREHLLRCSACRKELKALVNTVNALRSLPEKPAPAGFALRLQARLAQEQNGWRRWVARLDQALSAIPLKPMTAVAAAVFVLVLLLSTGNQLPTNKAKFAANNQVPGVLAAATEPVPVEFAATHPGGLANGIFLDTPIDFITAIIKNDPALKGYQTLPHPRGNGALLSTPDYLDEITVDPAEFPIIQAYVEQHGGHLPQTLKQARAIYPIYIRTLPSPTKPLEPTPDQTQP